MTINNKEYIKWKQNRKKKRAAVIASLTAIGVGGGLGAGYAIWHNSKGNPIPTTQDFKIVRKTIGSGILSKAKDEMLLVAVNGSGHIKWTGEGMTILEELQNEGWLEYDNSESSILHITVKYDLSIGNKNELHLQAIDENGNKSNTTIPVEEVEYRPIPLTEEYFSITKPGPEEIHISGFSQEVDSGKISLKYYNTLDFNSELKVKITENCNFKKEVMEEWQPIEMNFGSAMFIPGNPSDWEPNKFSTGIRLFANYDLHSLIKLRFDNSVWWDDTTISTGGFSLYTAHETFREADLSGLTEINASGAKFAKENMSSRTSSTNSQHFYICFQTFSHANLNSLKKIDFSNATFALKEMTNLYDALKAPPSKICYNMFSQGEGIYLDALVDLHLPPNLGMKNSDDTLVKWFQSFKPKTVDPNFTIHWSEYDESTSPRPDYWIDDNSWFSGATWTRD